MGALALRVIRQIAGDKRTLGLLLFAPIILLTLIYFLLGDSGYVPKVAVYEDNAPPSAVAALEKAWPDDAGSDGENGEASLVRIESEADASRKGLLKDGVADAVLEFTNSELTVHMLESGTKSGKALTAISDAMKALQGENRALSMKTDFLYGEESGSTFDRLGFVFLGFLPFFLIFIISGMSLIRERSGGTLERFLMTPIRRRQVIFGYTAGYGVFAIMQSIIIALYVMFILKLPCVGNIAWVLLAMLLMAVVAVLFGALLSIFANNEFQMIQMVPTTIVPQVFFSGLIELDTMPYHLGNICYVMPIYYGCATIKKVMVEGAGFSVIWPLLLVLLCLIVLLAALNTFALKKYRRI